MPRHILRPEYCEHLSRQGARASLPLRPVPQANTGHVGSRHNHLNTLRTRLAAASQLYSSFQNVLGSGRDVGYRRSFSSYALFHDRTGRRYNRRLPAATFGPGSKPVACIGSFLGL